MMMIIIIIIVVIIKYSLHESYIIIDRMVVWKKMIINGSSQSSYDD